MSKKQYVPTVTTRKCENPDCGKPYFGMGKISKSPTCAGHYQRERRLWLKIEAGETVSPEEINRLSTPGSIQQYGEGSNQISTRVTDAELGWLDELALQRYPLPDGTGDRSAMLREIFRLFKEGNPADPGESFALLEGEAQEHGANDVDAQQTTEHQPSVAR